MNSQYPLSFVAVDEPSMVTTAPTIGISPASWTPLLLSSLHTKPQTIPPDVQLCPSAVLTATAASGTSAAASAAAFTCFNRPCSSACVFCCSSVSLIRDIHILLWGPVVDVFICR